MSTAATPSAASNQNKTVIQRFLQYPSPLTVAAESIVVLIYTTIMSILATVFFSLPYTAYQAILQLVRATSSLEPAPKTVLITGASNGIGRALAVKYAKEGSENIYITGRNLSALDEAVTEVKKVNASTNVVPLKLDVTDKEGMRAIITKYDALTPIDVVICNAGISPEQQRHKTQEEVYNDTYATNINGVLNTIFPLYNTFIDRKAGHFVIISSIASFGSIAHPAYSSSKALMTTLGQGLRRDLAAHNVKVTTICPGFVRSNITIERHEQREGGLPFFMEQEPAVEIIYNGILNNIDVIVFPFQMHVLAWALKFLPFVLQDKIALYLARKAYRSDKSNTGVDATNTDGAAQDAKKSK